MCIIVSLRDYPHNLALLTMPHMGNVCVGDFVRDQVSSGFANREATKLTKSVIVPFAPTVRRPAIVKRHHFVIYAPK